MGAMTDESVDTFYSCLLCQSFAPNHVCVITPQRLGLCGAYNWLDGKAAYEMNPHGGNLPVRKSDVIDPVLGQWKGINDFVSHGVEWHLHAVLRLLDDRRPHDFVRVLRVRGLRAAGNRRNHGGGSRIAGQTPVGMTFSSLAEMVGGGQQTPGFIGIGTLYMLSKKFISADGGLPRLVWTTTRIKEKLGERLRQRCGEIGQPELYGKIADETVCTELEPLIEHLAGVEHPALALGEMI